MFSVPRHIDVEYDFEKNHKMQHLHFEGWNVEHSIFKDFKADNELFLKECFE